MEKSSRLYWSSQFVTVTYNGACSRNVFLSEWREFPSAPCFAGERKLDDSSVHHVVEIAHVAWYASLQPM